MSYLQWKYVQQGCQRRAKFTTPMHRRFPLQGSDAEKDLEPQQRQFKGLSKSIRRIQRNQRSPQNFLPTISEVEEAQLPWSNYQAMQQSGMPPPDRGSFFGGAANIRRRVSPTISLQAYLSSRNGTAGDLIFNQESESIQKVSHRRTDFEELADEEAEACSPQTDRAEPHTRHERLQTIDSAGDMERALVSPSQVKRWSDISDSGSTTSEDTSSSRSDTIVAMAELRGVIQQKKAHQRSQLREASALARARHQLLKIRQMRPKERIHDARPMLDHQGTQLQRFGAEEYPFREKDWDNSLSIFEEILRLSHSLESRINEFNTSVRETYLNVDEMSQTATTTSEMCSPSDSDQADWGSDSEADVQSPTAESPSSTNFQYVNYNEDAAAIPDYQSCPSEPSSGSSKPTKVQRQVTFKLDDHISGPSDVDSPVPVYEDDKVLYCDAQQTEKIEVAESKLHSRSCGTSSPEDFAGHAWQQASLSNGKVYRGEEADSGEIYSGTFQEGQRSGLGVHRQQCGTTYSGMLAHDVYQGFGMLETGSGQCLQAEFCNGQVHGWGIRFFANGTEAAGRWSGSKLLWSRAISSEADVSALNRLDQQGVRLAIEAACLARCKAREAVKSAQKARRLHSSSTKAL